MKEIFKDIEGYESYYQISNLGRVKSLKRTKKSKSGVIYTVKERILKQSLKVTVCGNYKYPIVNLSKNGKAKHHSVHRLIACAFIPNPENKPHVNHIDSNTQNNSIENLEWCTHKENMWHGARSTNDHNMTIERAKEIRNYYKNGLVSIKQIAAKENMTYRSVYLLVNKETWV